MFLKRIKMPQAKNIYLTKKNKHTLITMFIQCVNGGSNWMHSLAVVHQPPGTLFWILLDHSFCLHNPWAFWPECHPWCWVQRWHLMVVWLLLFPFFLYSSWLVFVCPVCLSPGAWKYKNYNLVWQGQISQNKVLFENITKSITSKALTYLEGGGSIAASEPTKM